MANPGLFRLYARVVILGFWGVLFGVGAILIAAATLSSMEGGATGSNQFLGQVSLVPFLLAGFHGLFDAGVVSIGVGVVLLLVGARLSFAGISV